MSEQHEAPAAFETRAIHVGQAPDPTTGAVIPPLYLTSTYAQDGVAKLRAGYDYSRSGNPTRDALQAAIASLEGAGRAFSFASGLAAEDALLRSVLRPGDRVLLGNDAYGGTYRLLSTVYRNWGIELVTADLTDPEALASVIADRVPALIWVETPTNPLLTIVDISAVAHAAHAAGALLVVDNTFATPYLQRPLDWGADAVVHSTTKYFGGHSDVVGGAVAVNDPELADALAFQQNSAGAVSAPFDAWLTLRGLKTLALRMERHSANAARIATELERHSQISQVLYPGLESHPGHELAARQMRAFGGMLSVRLAGGPKAARALAEGTHLFTLAESLGGVESLIEYPYAMTHASAQGSSLEVPDDLVRISVGIEDVEDQLLDLTSALSALEG
ncbi:MAG: cystathionine gamma-synthase [Microbacteriaceae bacterium]|jgi:cystathionine gamma-synthase|nr:cystathionine gamma-synthase [Microbacteriaceae bacterium]MCI1207805.1 cystathionine gamma-synthase [Microbacteriaceae bacterium]